MVFFHCRLRIKCSKLACITQSREQQTLTGVSVRLQTDEQNNAAEVSDEHPIPDTLFIYEYFVYFANLHRIS